MRTSDSIVELVKALITARQTFAPVRRQSAAQIGQSRSYSYADMSTVLEAVMQPLLDHGLVVLQALDAETSTLLTRLVHTSGEWVESSYPLQMDQPPQALGSAVTYGRRYSLQSLLCLAAEDDDGAAAQPAKGPARVPVSKPAAMATPVDGAPATCQRLGTISSEQVHRLWAIAEARGWRRDDVRNWLIAAFAVPSSSDIMVGDYDAILAHLEAGPPRPATVANDPAF